jgi:hypothetical protein
MALSTTQATIRQAEKQPALAEREKKARLDSLIIEQLRVAS